MLGHIFVAFVGIITDGVVGQGPHHIGDGVDVRVMGLDVDAIVAQIVQILIGLCVVLCIGVHCLKRNADLLVHDVEGVAHGELGKVGELVFEIEEPQVGAVIRGLEARAVGGEPVADDILIAIAFRAGQQHDQPVDIRAQVVDGQAVIYAEGVRSLQIRQ